MPISLESLLLCIFAHLKRFRHCSFIHSGHFYSAHSSPLLLRGAPDYSTDTVSEFHAETHRQLQVKDLSKTPDVAAIEQGVEPTTLRLKVIVSTKAPPRPTASHVSMIFTTVIINITVINVIVNLVITIAFKIIIISKFSIVIIIKY